MQAVQGAVEREATGTSGIVDLRRRMTNKETPVACISGMQMRSILEDHRQDVAKGFGGW